MTEFAHPTNPEWIMFDGVDKASPDYREPPKGNNSLLVLGKGGVLNKGPFTHGVDECWCFSPKEPPSYKARNTARLLALREHSDALEAQR